MNIRAFAAGAWLAALCAAPALAGPVTADLALWLKADDGLATDGSSWADRSGNGHDATAVQGQAPTYVASAINGLPAAHFGGAQLMSIAGQVLTSQHFTIIVVATDESTPQHGNLCDVVSNWSGATGTRSIFLGTVWKRPDDKFLDRIRFTDAIGGSDQGQEGVARIPHPAHAFILSAVSKKDDAQVYVGGKRKYALGTKLRRRDLSAGWFLGDQGNCFCEYWLGDVAEVLVYDKALSRADFEADIAYLQSKWQ
ncbi:MAG TPA: hypothetical protein VG889_04510 [Rhizomicrobium sp.]|nr:hypothetical protein [Rhizomicrobium sp.]